MFHKQDSGGSHRSTAHASIWRAFWGSRSIFAFQFQIQKKEMWKIRQLSLKPFDTDNFTWTGLLQGCRLCRKRQHLQETKRPKIWTLRWFEDVKMGCEFWNQISRELPLHSILMDPKEQKVTKMKKIKYSYTWLQTNKPNSIPHIYFEQFQKVSNLHTSLFIEKYWINTEIHKK